MPRSVERPVAAHPDVRIDEVVQRPAYFEPPVEQARVPVQQAAPTAFVPPAPEQPMRPARMPQIDDLPPHIRDQIRAHQAGQATGAVATTEQRRRTLLGRLAAFGSSRSAEEPKPTPAAAQLPPPVAPAAPRAPAPAHADYAKRPAAPRQQGLDQHGRAAPVQRSFEEDQLEIPAFLRRQSH